MSGFKLNYKILWLLFLLSATGCPSGSTGTQTLKCKGYAINAAGDAVSEKWAEYLYSHLRKRCSKDNVVFLQEGNSGHFQIRVEVTPSLGYDYCIENRDRNLVMKAKNEKVILWLIYQYIKQLSCSDKRFEATDLPPAIIGFETCCRDFDFEYREPFFNPNLTDSEYPGIIGTHSIETDWGIWGHNLGKILNTDGNNAVYARQGIWIEEDQYCFSAEETFMQIKEYIKKEYGDAHSMHFMIMPNDNAIACTCHLCKSHGNSGGIATPSVAFLITRLAEEFPQHIFFTSAYLTTLYPPAEELPENTGVMLSTIDLPKGVGLDGTEEGQEFKELLDRWKKITPNIYIWDYAANFDDYLTPVPILYGLKKQLDFYKSIGVKGVFLNGSGYTYSSFDDMKTFVAASLMIDNNLPVDSLCYLYLNQFYPVSGTQLGNYYLSLEKRLEKLNEPYDMYGSFRGMLRTFLDKDEFMAFYESLNSLISATEGIEKQKLSKLFTAMSYTRLQLAYTQGSKLYGFAILRNKEMFPNQYIENIYKDLEGYKDYPDFFHFKEEGGELNTYFMNWDRLLERMPWKNYLIGVPVKILSAVDEDYALDTYMLNDGVFGFYGDYHQGWYLSGADDLQVQLDNESWKEANIISLRFLVDPKHNIYPPEKVEIITNGVLYKTAMPANTLEFNSSKTRVVRTDIETDFSKAETVILKIYKNKKTPGGSIACDEIQLK